MYINNNNNNNNDDDDDDDGDDDDQFLLTKQVPSLAERVTIYIWYTLTMGSVLHALTRVLEKGATELCVSVCVSVSLLSIHLNEISTV